MSQRDLNCSGIYFLASRFIDGSYIYKVGKSENIASRIKQYPQNFDVILQFECVNKNISEKEVIQVVERLEASGITKCERGNEFFRSETDKIKDIKIAIYDWYYDIERTRTRGITEEVEETPEPSIRADIETCVTLSEHTQTNESETNKEIEPFYEEKKIFQDSRVINPDFPFFKLIDVEPEIEKFMKEQQTKFDPVQKNLEIQFNDYEYVESCILGKILNYLIDDLQGLTIINGYMIMRNMEVLLKWVSTSNITSLSICRDHLAFGTVKMLMRYLKHHENKKIINLSLSNTGLNSRDADYIARHINMTSVENIDLSCNESSDAFPLKFIMKKFTNLRTVNLAGCCLKTYIRYKVISILSRNNFSIQGSDLIIKV